MFKNFWKKRTANDTPTKNPNELYQWCAELPLAESGYTNSIHRVRVERCRYGKGWSELLELQQCLRGRAERYFLPQVKPRHLWTSEDQERAATLAELFQSPSHRITLSYWRKDNDSATKSEKIILDAILCLNLSGYSSDAIATTLGRYLRQHLKDFITTGHKLPVNVDKHYYLQQNQIAEAFWLSSLMVRYRSIVNG